MRAATTDAVEAQYRDITGQLERHSDAILGRIEELFDRQQEALMNALVSMQWAVPTDAAAPSAVQTTSIGSPVSIGQANVSALVAEFRNAGLKVCPDIVDVETQTGGSAMATAGLNFASAVNPGINLTVAGTGVAKFHGSGKKTLAELEARKKEMEAAAKAIEVPTGAAGAAAFVAAEDKRGNPEMAQEHTGWQAYIASERFDMCAGFLIVLNAIVMVVQLEHQGLQTGGRIGANSPEDAAWPYADAGFLVVDHIFCWVFLTELTLRVLTFKVPYFLVIFNWIDIVTVIFTIFELYMFPLLNLNLPNFTFVRLLRLLKLVKVLRVVRVMRLFHQLRVLVVAIASSVSALIWSIIFLTIVQAIAALFMTQVMNNFIIDPLQPAKTRTDCFHYFGRWSQSMLTMYQITLAPGAWGPIGRLLIFDVHPLFVLFFIPYGWLVTFAVVRVISAMFLKQTMAAAQGDGEVAIMERMEKKDNDANKLRELFSAGDKDGSGEVDWEEFQAMIDTPHVKARLGMLDLDVHDLNMLFNLLDDGDGKICFDEFISGVLRCRGGARGVDVASLLSESQNILTEIEEIREYLEVCGVQCKKIEPQHGTEETGEDPDTVKDGGMPSMVMIASSESSLQQTPGWRHFVRSRRFDMIAGVIICVNALVMAAEMEYKGLQAGAALGINPEEEAQWSGADEAFQALDQVFCAIFLGELILRVAATGCSFFLHIVNWVDIITVATSILELWILKLLMLEMPNVQLISLLRLLRLTKVARILRVMKLFHQLRVLVSSICATVATLAWSIIFLAVVQAICAILMTQVLYEFLDNPENDLGVQAETHRYFGRWTHTMLTMHQLTLAPGAWGNIGRLLIFKVSPAFVLFFIPFGWMVTFAMVNVISAIFLKQTLAAAAGDSEVAVMERLAKKQKDIARLREIFREGDKDGSGSVDWQEFQTMIQNPRVRAWLGILELDVSDMATVFNLLDDGDGHIEFEEFISGVMKCRGAARGIEVVNLLSEYRRILQQLDEIKNNLRDSLPDDALLQKMEPE